MILFCREITHNRVEKACSREMVISAGLLNNRIIKRLVNSLYHEARKSFYWQMRPPLRSPGARWEEG